MFLLTLIHYLRQSGSTAKIVSPDDKTPIITVIIKYLLGKNVPFASFHPYSNPHIPLAFKLAKKETLDSVIILSG